MTDRKTDAASNADATRACPRAEELVTFLYGEATDEEARRFGEHMSACADCREEFAAFGGVRESVRAWRDEALNAASPLDAQGVLASSTNASHASAGSQFVQADDAGGLSTDAARAAVRKRSALAALREFFALAPLWLQVGATAAALLLCALAALTLARAEVSWGAEGFALRTGGRERVVEKKVEVPVESEAARAELSAVAAERDRFKSELETLRAERSALPALSAGAKQNDMVDEATSKARRAEVARAEVGVGEPARVRRAARKGGPRADEVAKNRRLGERDEDNLPGLFDLLSEVR